MTFYERHKGPTEGYCRLCGDFSKLTVDHVPPKSCSNSGRYLIRDVVNHEQILRAKNGLTFRTICAKCNNGRLGPLDSELNKFANQAKEFIKSKATGLTFSEGYKVTIPSQKIVQCIAGHLLAVHDSLGGLSQKLDHSKYPYLAAMHQLFEGAHLPQYTVGAWLHEYPTVNIYPSAGTIVLFSNDTPSMFSLLSFFPLGFMIINRQYHPERIPFLRLRTDQAFITVDLAAFKKLSPKFPLDTLTDEVVAINSGQAYEAEKLPRVYY